MPKIMRRVARNFPNLQSVETGDVVDASEWCNRLLLEEGGFLVPVEAETSKEAPAAKKVEPIEEKQADTKAAAKPEIVFEEEEYVIPEPKPVSKTVSKTVKK